MADGNTGNIEVLRGAQGLNAEIPIRRDFAIAKQVVFNAGGSH